MPKPQRWLLVRTYTGERIDAALQYGQASGKKTVRVLDSNQFPVEWQESNLGDFVIGILDKSPSLVLSQNCDISTKDHIQVAPIIPVESGNKEQLDRLKSHQILDAFYLAPHPPQWDGDAFADFGLIQSIHKSYLKSLPRASHFRISASNAILLQRDLTRFFGRPNAFDVNADRVPRDGTYLCVQCFYYAGMISAMQLKEGDAFVQCGSCEGLRWVPQMNTMPTA